MQYLTTLLFLLFTVIVINPFRFCAKIMILLKKTYAVGVTRDNKQIFKQAIPLVEKAIELTNIESHANNTNKELEAAYPKQ
ncbi:MAG: hypothetical protein CMM06_06055 [Rhodopirellula sp.]|nr:hypothetical protein [Rhodopirellula sp.]|tara:strand:+ start:10581 stop:10823 length:243 start_codon:yes stop_codon:yes gene_type:complete